MSKKVRLIICGISAVVLAVLLGVLVFQKNAKDENLAAQPESVATNDVIGMETQTKEQAEEGISLQDSNTYLIDSMDITYISLSNNGITVNGSGASVSSEGVKIEKAGNYEITGTLSEGQIKVNAGDEDIVVLTLNNVNLTCLSDNAIQIKNCKDAIIVLAEGSKNSVISGKTKEITDAASSEEASGAAINSKTMLEITGSGYLKVEGYINNGIAAKETLRLDAANLEAVAVNNAIKSKSYIYVSDGNYILIAGNDGIKADKGEEDGVAGITIENGSFDITSFGDAVSAEGDLNIKDGEFAIVTNGGYDSALSAAQGFGKMENTMPENGMTGGMPSNGHIPSEGQMPGNGQIPSDGQMPGNGQIPSNGQMPDQNNMKGPGNRGEMQGNPRQNQGFSDQRWDMSSSDETSRKGLKAGQSLVIEGGSFSINSYDDAIHTNGSLYINGGVFKLSSSDDGIHADNSLEINGGDIDITYSYEGIEGNELTVNGGVISLYAADDGFNASGDSPKLVINDGDIYVNADGDGLDSNGDLIINGGNVVVDGPTNSANGALDSGTESGGELIVNGGTILCIGAAGMAESFGGNSTQASFISYINVSAGNAITVSDALGNEIFSYTAKKGGNSVVFSSAELNVGDTYTISSGNNSENITLSSITNTNGNALNGFNGYNYNGNGGFRGPRQ